MQLVRSMGSTQG